MFMPAHRNGSITYVLREQCLHMCWSPDIGAEVDIPLYDFNEGVALIATRVPRGYYPHFRQLLVGNTCDRAGNHLSHVTTLNNPDAIIVFRMVLVPSALVVCSRFCRQAACESVMEDVYHIATLPSHSIPAVCFC